MIKIFTILIGLVLCGCASQPTEPAQEELDIHVFYEEPKIDYESLGRVDETSRTNHPMDMLEKILSRAVELGADAVLIHSIHNKGTVAGGLTHLGQAEVVGRCISDTGNCDTLRQLIDTT